MRRHFLTAKIEPITLPESLLTLPDDNITDPSLTALTCPADIGEFFESVQMYDTSPLTPFKGETKPFLHVEIDNKTLESLFDLHPSLENSFDLTAFVASAVSGGEHAANSPSGIPDSAVVTSPVASSATDLLTLSSAATSQHLAEIERHTGGGIVSNHHHHNSSNNNNTNNNFVPQQSSPGSVVPSTPSPPAVSHLHHHHQHQHHQQPVQQLQGYQQSLSPSLTVDDVSQAFSDDSCVFMPEYEQLGIATTAPATTSTSGGGGAWGQEPYYTTVKTEDLGLSTLTACSLEASLPGFTSSATTTATAAATSSSSSSSAALDMGCKMELGGGGEDGAGHYGGVGAAARLSSPRCSLRTLSESSTATTSTVPDSPRRMSKGGSKRRQVPKGSEEYKEKRARNNVAVRKSRAKAKEKQKMTESRVKELMDQNESLTKKVEMLTKELTVLRGLFVNVGATLPDDFSKLMEQS